MKTKNNRLMFFFYFLFFTVILASCNKVLKSYKPINKSETELFHEASQMNGLGIFKIGNTTIQQIIQLNKDIQQDQRYGSLFEGYWIGSKFKVEEDVLESCSLTQMYNIDKFFIGDEEINDLNLSFYKDTLYEISCNSSESIKDAFTKKYGVGKRDSSNVESGLKNHKNYNNHYHIIWENNSIITDLNEVFKTNDGKVMSNIHTVSIKTKNVALLKEILDCDNEAYSKKTSEEEKKRQQNLDKF